MVVQIHYCRQGRRWPGGPGVRIPTIDQDDPRDSCKSGNKEGGEGREGKEKGGRGKEEKVFDLSSGKAGTAPNSRPLKLKINCLKIESLTVVSTKPPQKYYTFYRKLFKQGPPSQVDRDS
jgi:hypothetical protein